MKKVLFVLSLLFSAAAFAAPVDAEYQIAIPAQESVCVTPFANLPDPSYNCYYTSVGEFTDRLEFTVDGATTNTFEVVDVSYRYTVSAGRAHPTYTFSTTLTNVVIVDSLGNIVAQLTDAPFWSHPSCVDVHNFCSPHLTDDWFVSAQLPAGSYSLVIMGTISGNRPGSYSFTVQ